MEPAPPARAGVSGLFAETGRSETAEGSHPIPTSADQPRARLGYAAPLEVRQRGRAFVIFSRPHVTGRSISGEREGRVLDFVAPRAARRAGGVRFVIAIAALALLVPPWCGPAAADPQDDPLVELKELSQQAEQLAATVQTAQATLDNRLQALTRADQAHAVDLAEFDAASGRLASYQQAVDVLAAAVYTGGRADGLHALLTATTPKGLIDKLSVQRVMATEMSSRMRGFRQAEREAKLREATAAKSAAAAAAAVEAAAEVRADLQSTQSELRSRIAAVQAKGLMLDTAGQAVSPGSVILPGSVIAASDLVAPVPAIGMNGLVPNASVLAAYIMSTFPGVQSIGGVRADPLPDHPSGRALDIMTGTNMDLGDAINADLQRQAGRFGIDYTMWRVPDHFNHVHVTVS